MDWVQVDTGLIRHAPGENPSTLPLTDETLMVCETPGTGGLNTDTERSKGAQADAGGEEPYPDEPPAQDGSAPVPPDAPQGEAQADTTETRLRLRLLHNEVERVGAELGLLDADAALRLMQEDFATVDGEGNVTGVREALEGLRKQKGYLFAPPARAAWAQRVGTAAPAMAGGVEEAFYRKNPALRK